MICAWLIKLMAVFAGSAATYWLASDTSLMAIITGLSDATLLGPADECGGQSSLVSHNSRAIGFTSLAVVVFINFPAEPSDPFCRSP